MSGAAASSADGIVQEEKGDEELPELELEPHEGERCYGPMRVFRSVRGRDLVYGPSQDKKGCVKKGYVLRLHPRHSHPKGAFELVVASLRRPARRLREFWSKVEGTWCVLFSFPAL